MSAPPPAAPGPRAPRVGLTGGISSGKSTVSHLFEKLGVPVLDADIIARDVIAPGTSLLATLFERFGPGIRADDGSLDRSALRQIVFSDEARRRELESLMHPAIRARTEQLAAQTKGAYQLHVVPLLVETHAQTHYDRILVVDCPGSLQLTRLLARDGMSETEARAMLGSQASRAARLASADDVILNDGALDALGPRVAALHARYLALWAAAPI
jgi:dephospho-CoA kinase